MLAVSHYGLFSLSHLEGTELLDSSQEIKLLLLLFYISYHLTPHDLLEGLDLSFEDYSSVRKS